VARDGAVSGRYQPVVLAFSSHVSERNAHIGEQIKIVVAVDLDVATVPIYEARRSRRQIEVEQAPDNDRVRMPFDNFLDTAFKGGKGLAEYRDARRAGGPVDAIEALTALLFAIAESSREIQLVRPENVDPEQPVAFDQCEGRCLSIDADHEAWRINAQGGHRSDRHPRDIATETGGDDADAAGKTAHDQPKLQFDFVVFSREMNVRSGHLFLSSPPQAS